MTSSLKPKASVATSNNHSLPRGVVCRIWRRDEELRVEEGRDEWHDDGPSRLNGSNKVVTTKKRVSLGSPCTYILSHIVLVSVRDAGGTCSSVTGDVDKSYYPLMRRQQLNNTPIKVSIKPFQGYFEHRLGQERTAASTAARRSSAAHERARWLTLAQIVWDSKRVALLYVQVERGQV